MFFMGCIPANTPGGNSGSVARNQGSLVLNTNLGTPPVDTWNVLYTNGLLTVDSDFYPNGHPATPGSTAMALWHVQQLGFETNVGTVKIDYSDLSAVTNHWTASSISKTPLSLTATIRADRMPMSWDVPGGQRTNNAVPMFTEAPLLQTLFTWTISVTNLPTGMYNVFIDGQLTEVKTAAQLAYPGINLFTNYNNAFGYQRLAVLDAIRDVYGVDHYTLINAHGAGATGVGGFRDLINLTSDENQQYVNNGLRGSAYLATLTTDLSGMASLFALANASAQQTNHTLLVTLQYSANATTLKSGTTHWGQ